MAKQTAPEITDIHEITDPRELALIAQQQRQKQAETVVPAGTPGDPAAANKDTPPQNGTPADPKKEAVTEKKPEEKKPESDKPKDEPKAESGTGEEVKPRNIRERLSPYRGKDGDAKPEVPTVESLQSKVEELENRLKEYQDPDFEALKGAKKEGINLYELVQKNAGVDVDKLPDAEVYAMSLDKTRFKSEQDGDYDENRHESLEAEMERFNNQTAYTKHQQAQEIRAGIKSENEKNRGSLFDFRKQADPEQIKTYETFGKDLKSYAQKLDGQTHYGVKMTGEMIKSVIGDIVNPAEPRMVDGRIDAQKKFDDAFWARYRDLILQEAIEDTKYETVHKEADETEAKPGSAVHNRPPDIPVKLTGEEKAKQASETMQPLR
jgi:hypothetical protein